MILIQKDAVVIGGGISGLAAAFYLKRTGRDVLLCEASDRVGGGIRSVKVQGYLLEEGPNTFMGLTSDLMEMIDAVGLTSELQFPDAHSRKRYVYKGGRLHRVPTNPIHLVTSKLLSFRGKCRLAREPFVRGEYKQGESVSDFFTRRFGPELTQNMVDPFMSGIYAGDISKLSIEAVLPRLVEFEKECGSVIKGALKFKGPKRDRRLFSFSDGLQALPNAIQKWLGEAISLNTTVNKIEKHSDKGWRMSVNKNGSDVVCEARNIILAIPGHVLSTLVESVDTKLSEALHKIPYAPLIVYHLGFKREAIQNKLEGFGFLIPRCEKMKTLGVLWSSSLFMHRSPKGEVLLTVMTGGATQPEEVLKELNGILGISGEPTLIRERRYERAIPQYNKGHGSIVKRVREFEARHKGLHVIGNFLDGPSCPQCISNGKAIVSKLY